VTAPFAETALWCITLYLALVVGGYYVHSGFEAWLAVRERLAKAHEDAAKAVVTLTDRLAVVEADLAKHNLATGLRGRV
jgi:hypothetical protein